VIVIHYFGGVITLTTLEIVKFDKNLLSNVLVKS
jgi:hypothetical protein